MPTNEHETHRKFSLDTKLVFQQDLSQQLAVYLETKRPSLAHDFDQIFPRPPGSLRTLGERMAIRCCLPLTMLRYLQSAGLLMNVEPMEYIDKVWAAFDFENIKNWSRPILSKLTRQEYDVPIISCGVRWLNQPLSDDAKKAMIKSGYCDNGAQISLYLDLLHAKTIEQIIEYSPIVLTIKNPVGSRDVHSVIAWSIENGQLNYSTTDIRDGDKKVLNKISADHLKSSETMNGAITLLV